MTKKILLSIIAIPIAVLGSPIQAWLSGDEKARLYSGKQLIVTAAVLLAVFVFAAILETPRALAWNWPWHRFWFFKDLLEQEKMRSRQIFQTLNTHEKPALMEVIESGKQRNLLAMLLEKIAILNPVPKIFITGEGGSGKTTTMEQLRLNLVRDGVKRLAFGKPIPVLLRMGSAGPGKLLDNVREVMEEGSSSSKVLSKGLTDLLKKGRIALLIDSIDESLGQNPNAFREVVKLIENTDYNLAPVIVSGRRGEYEQQLPAFVETLHIVELSDDAVLEVCREYVTQRRAESADEIFATLRGHGLLKPGGLGKNLFWLTLILQGGTFENNKTKIFDEAIDSLLKREWAKTGKETRWKRRVDEDEQLLETRAALARLAHEVSIRNQKETIDGVEALGVIDNYLSGRVGVRDVLRAQDVLYLGLDAQLLYFPPLKSRDDWPPIRFSHRLIREYLTANLLSKQPDLLVKVFADNAGNTEWWEILLMLSSISGGTAGTRQKLIDAAVGEAKDIKRLFLAAVILRATHLMFADVKRPPLSLLVESLRQNLTVIHSDAAMSVASIAPDRLIELLERLMKLEDPQLSGNVNTLVTELVNNEIAKTASGRLISELLSSVELREAARPALVSIGRAAVAHIVPVLRDSSITARWSAAEVLGEIRDRDAVAPLLKTLSDSNQVVRDSAIEALGKIGDPIAITHFAEMLDSVKGTDQSLFLNAQVSKALGAMGEPAIEYLVGMLQQHDESVLSTFAVDAVKQIGKPAVPAVIRVLNKLGVFELQGLVLWLAEMEAVEAIEPLLAAARRNPLVLHVSEQAVVRFGKAAVEPLISLIDDADVLTKSFAMDLLGQIGGERAFETLITLLKTRTARPNSEAQQTETLDRSSAAEALGKLGDERAIPALETAAKEESWLIRIKTSTALVQLGQADALDGVLEGLNAGEPPVIGLAISELGKLKQARSLMNLERFVRTATRSEAMQKNLDEAIHAIETISREVSGLPVEKEDQAEQTPRQRDFSGYAQLLKHPDRTIRLDVVKALAEVESPPFDLLRTAFADENQRVRMEAAEVLGKTKHPEARALLIESLQREPHNAVRMAAAEALSNFKDDEVRELLTKALEDPYMVVKIGAATGLARLGDRNMLSQLAEIVEQNDAPTFKFMVAHAYGGLGDPAAVPYLEKIVAAYREQATTPQEMSNLEHMTVISNYLQQLGESQQKPPGHS